MAEWAAAEADLDATGALVIAIERHSAGELGVSMVAGGRMPDDERVFLQSFTFTDRDTAYAWAAQLRTWYSSSRVLAAEDLVGDKGARDLHARKVGASDARPGVTLLREELAAGRVAHWCSPEHRPGLDEQLAQARVVATPAGNLSIVSAGRTDAVRALMWALTELVQNPPRIPVIHGAPASS